jgi:hypothetical protein
MPAPSPAPGPAPDAANPLNCGIWLDDRQFVGEYLATSGNPQITEELCLMECASKQGCNSVSFYLFEDQYMCDMYAYMNFGFVANAGTKTFLKCPDDPDFPDVIIPP